MHGHADPALNIPLHDLIRGGSHYPDASKEETEDLRNTYKFVRGCLIELTKEGEKIVTPPCLRADVVSKAHEELVHAGRERRRDYLLNIFGLFNQTSSDKFVCTAQVFRLFLANTRIVGTSSDQIVKRYVEGRIGVTVHQSRGAIRAEPVAN